MTEESTVPKIGKERLLEWLAQARKVGEWPASIDQGREKFIETYDALVELVNRTHLKIEVVHKHSEPGPVILEEGSTPSPGSDTDESAGGDGGDS